MTNLIQVLACPACASAFEEAGGDSLGWAIFVVLILIVTILGGVGFTLFRMARREHNNLDARYMDDIF